MSQLSPEIQKIIDRLNARDPGSAKGMVIQENEMVELKVSDLRTICLANPEHQSAVVIGNAIQYHPPSEKVTVEKVQIDAITQNRQVTIETDADGVERKFIDYDDQTTNPAPVDPFDE